MAGRIDYRWRYMRAWLGTQRWVPMRFAMWVLPWANKKEQG